MTNTYRVTLTIEIKGETAEEAALIFVQCVTRGQFQGQTLKVEQKDMSLFADRYADTEEFIDPVDLL